jgi:hypothetical protein
VTFLQKFTIIVIAQRRVKAWIARNPEGKRAHSTGTSIKEGGGNRFEVLAIMTSFVQGRKGWRFNVCAVGVFTIGVERVAHATCTSVYGQERSSNIYVLDTIPIHSAVP